MCLYLFVYIFQERKILEETVTPLNPTGLLNQQPVQTGTTPSATENNAAEGGNVPQNGQRREATDDQHESKLHFFQGEENAGGVHMCVPAQQLQPCVPQTFFDEVSFYDLFV